MKLNNLSNSGFASRHIGPDSKETQKMLQTVGINSLDKLIDLTIPDSIKLNKPIPLPSPLTEYEYLQLLRKIAQKNKVYKTYIGQGYYSTITPTVILRNVLENPGWYTQYTPYQAEIAQGRLECLLNFQTMITDLTGLPMANSGLLDEGTAAAEAMVMLYAYKKRNSNDLICNKFFIDSAVFPQTIDVLITRAEPIGIKIVIGNYQNVDLDTTYFGALLQYPNGNGNIEDYRNFIDKVHNIDALVVMATDLLALTLLTSPGELGADVSIGSVQRFGVPMGYGGPQAAFFAAKNIFKRMLPGRLIGVSIDRYGNKALRMALQTREQHIRREKATSNICTSASLVANIATLYAAYHGPAGLKRIAERIATYSHGLANVIKAVLPQQYKIMHEHFFDTILMEVPSVKAIKEVAEAKKVNFRYIDETHLSISIDETTSIDDLQTIINTLRITGHYSELVKVEKYLTNEYNLPNQLLRSSTYLLHPEFNSYHSETEMMRYIKRLENKDLSLNTSMIALGSCTMKLNSATEMIPVTWPEFSNIHPFVPINQALGYQQIIHELSDYLAKITGFYACSLQPSSGAHGEYAGLLTIRSYLQSKGELHRNIILIPVSAHGTNPASAVMAGFKVVVVNCDEQGNIDLTDLSLKAKMHSVNLAGIMITYPSTHGVFEENIKAICKLVHDNGGQVYMDGANMNAQVCLTSPGHIGADVCHLNLHKTFALPHGGGGPGVGPICVAKHLAAHLPGHIAFTNQQKMTPHAISSAPYGNASLLVIAYGYVRMMGFEGLKNATSYAILNANYMKVRLEKYFKVLYSGKNNTCAHEFIIDLRPFFITANITSEDVAKRLIDYGFHAPTLSFPVTGTIMIEPTESEDLKELDKFCDALINIYHEIKDIEDNKADRIDNLLKNSPHTQSIICADEWNHPYSRSQAVFPLDYVKENKFWPSISRVNNTYGDRNLTCTCEPVKNYIEVNDATLDSFATLEKVA